MKKTCTRCKEEKVDEAFSPDPNKTSGRDARCKDCRAELKRKRYALNPERYRREAKEYADKTGYHKSEVRRKSRRVSYARNREKARESSKRWRQENPERQMEYTRRKREKNPQMARAHSLLNTAVRRGKIVKPDACEDCGDEPGSSLIHGHHEDYAKPYNVQWLCVTCHTKAHGRAVELIA